MQAPVFCCCCCCRVATYHTTTFSLLGLKLQPYQQRKGEPLAKSYQAAVQNVFEAIDLFWLFKTKQRVHDNALLAGIELARVRFPPVARSSAHAPRGLRDELMEDLYVVHVAQVPLSGMRPRLPCGVREAAVQG